MYKVLLVTFKVVNGISAPEYQKSALRRQRTIDCPKVIKESRREGLPGGHTLFRYWNSLSPNLRNPMTELPTFKMNLTTALVQQARRDSLCMEMLTH